MDITQQLTELKSQLEATLDTKAKAAIEAEVKKLEAQQKGLDEVKKENEALKSRVEKMEADSAKAAADAVANQKALDELIADKKNIKAGQVYKTMGTEFSEKLMAEKDNIATIKTGRKQTVEFTLDSTKAVGNMASSTNFTGTGGFVAPQLTPGVTTLPFEEVHMRNLLPVGATTSNLIKYVRDLGGEGGPAMVAEGGTKPQMDRDFIVVDASVKKIATYLRVPEEMFDDIVYLQSLLVAIGLQELMSVEDAQILYGNGSGQNLSGLFTNATAFAAGPTTVITAPNQFDVIRAARKQLRNAKLGGQLIALLSPEDYFEMTSKKDSTNNYLFLGGGNGLSLQNPNVSGTGSNIGGIRIEEHTAIATGDFLVFSPTAAQIWDRTGTTVRFYDQDQDNAIKNLITIVIEKRLALAIYRPAGIIKGTFDNAISDLTTGS